MVCVNGRNFPVVQQELWAHGRCVDPTGACCYSVRFRRRISKHRDTGSCRKPHLRIFEPSENVSFPRGQGDSNGLTSQSSQGTSNDPYAGYVQYTLFPNNNTLLNGNVAGNENGTVLIDSGADPYELEYDPINNLVYVSDFLSGKISVVEPISNKVIFNITGFHFPTAFALDKKDNYLYVANLESNYVSVINASSGSYVGNISVPYNSKISGRWY